MAYNYTISYKRLFKMLVDMDLNKTEFAKKVGISANTLAKLSRNETISLDSLIRICQTLHCTVDDVLEILPEDHPKVKV